jgi:YD repeat-containing protein
LNGGAGVKYVDFSLKSGGLLLELSRSYNSITAINESKGWLGAFGWGWTSLFETVLTLTADRNVILRDGATGNTLVFRSEKEDPKLKAVFLEDIKRAYFSEIKGKLVSDTEAKKLELPEKISKRLKTDALYRAELALKYKLKGTVPNGQTLISTEYGYQTIEFKNNSWVREKDGITQIFDKEGRLTRQTDKAGNLLEFNYSPNQKYQLAEIHDKNRSISLKFTWRQDHVFEVVDNKNNKAQYRFDSNSNLVQSIDSNQQVYQYKYTDKKFPHLITRIDYASETTTTGPVFRELRYDENGLVTYHREKDGTETKYTYGKNPNDPENNFWTKIVKISGKNREEVQEDYTIKTRPDGTKYLYRQESKDKTGVITTLFTSCCGKPQEVTRNGTTTKYKYYPNGLLKEKISPTENIFIEYDPLWEKVSKIDLTGVIYKYEYDKKRGTIILATKTSTDKKEIVKLNYDKEGRVSDIQDEKNGRMSFQYASVGGRPSLISKKGIGAIQITYDQLGRVKASETILESKKDRKPSLVQSKEVLKKVMDGFQEYLEIIRPAKAGVDLPI